MRGVLGFILVLLLAGASFADFSYIGRLYVKDTGMWLNLSGTSDVWPAGDVTYVLDSGNHRIVKFQNGDVMSIILAPSGAPGGMLFPRGFFLGDDGRFYIANSEANNVLIYENSNYYGGIGVSGTDAYSFDRPSSIAVYGGKIYVADAQHGTVSYFSQKDRTFQGKIGSKGFGEGFLGEPWGIAITNGMLYVADKATDRVSMFYLNGTYVGRIKGAYDCSLSGPRGVAVDSEGTVFVSDTGNSRVVVFDSSGQCLETLRGSGYYDFSQPVGIRVDAQGKVYVADSGNSLVQIFKYTPYWKSAGGASARIDYAGLVLQEIAPIVSAAAHLGIFIPDAASPPLAVAKAELARQNYGNAYFNASLSASQAVGMNSSLLSLVHAEALKITLLDEEILGDVEDRAAAYKVSVDTGPLRAQVLGVRAMLNSGDYVGAAFNITAIHSAVLGLNASTSGSTSDTAKTRDGLWLAIGDSRNELSALTVSTSQYKLQINSSEAGALLDSAYAACGAYDFEACQAKLSEARGMIANAGLAVKAHEAKVVAERERIASAHQELSRAYGSAYFFKPDLGPAEKSLSEAEGLVASDPDAAADRVKNALSFIDGANAGVGRTNTLALIGFGALVILLLVAIGVYYATRGKPRKRKGL